MKKLMNRIKMNDKGFTLVELIVVVAILAVITVVVAPQYLSYVNKARIGTDENTIGEIAHVAEITYVEFKARDTDMTNAKVTVNINGSGEITSYTTVPAGMAAEIEKVVTKNQYVFKSEEYKEIGSVDITFTADGIAQWTTVGGVTMGGTH